MSLRRNSRLLDVIEATLDEVPALDPALRRAQLATIAEARALDRITDAARVGSRLSSSPLPADLADVDSGTRATIDALASRHRITPTAALALLRSGQRARAARRPAVLSRPVPESLQ